jgi:hypothetical protein
MFNPPPGDLNDREPSIHLASPADFWYRSYRIGNAPIFFGRSKSHRWDSPHGDFGVLYLGGDEYCAFMESIGRGALKTRFVPGSQLKSTGLAKVGFKRILRLVDMVTSGGLTRLASRADPATRIRNDGLGRSERIPPSPMGSTTARATTRRAASLPVRPHSRRAARGSHSRAANRKAA